MCYVLVVHFSMNDMLRSMWNTCTTPRSFICRAHVDSMNGTGLLLLIWILISACAFDMENWMYTSNILLLTNAVTDFFCDQMDAHFSDLKAWMWQLWFKRYANICWSIWVGVYMDGKNDDHSLPLLLVVWCALDDRFCIHIQQLYTSKWDCQNHVIRGTWMWSNGSVSVFVCWHKYEDTRFMFAKKTADIMPFKQAPSADYIWMGNYGRIYFLNL